MSCQIDAVYSAYLDVNLTDGALFTDSTNMPYLVLNEAAAKLFSEKRQRPPNGCSGRNPAEKRRCGDKSADLRDLSGRIRNTPNLYGLLIVARKLFGAQFTGTTIALRLVNKGVVESSGKSAETAAIRKCRYGYKPCMEPSGAANMADIFGKRCIRRLFRHSDTGKAPSGKAKYQRRMGDASDGGANDL